MAAATARSRPSFSAAWLSLSSGPRPRSSSPQTVHLPCSQRGKEGLAAAAVLGAAVSAVWIFPPPEAAAAAAALTDLISLQEPENALSLPTWAIHVSSVVEWILAMALVWEYGEKSGFESWKGLAWGMVPLLGGAFCACTWHFFYNAESLEILVALQAALTVIGNFTMCFAAYRIYRSSSQSSAGP